MIPKNTHTRTGTSTSTNPRTRSGTHNFSCSNGNNSDTFASSLRRIDINNGKKESLEAEKSLKNGGITESSSMTTQIESNFEHGSKTRNGNGVPSSVSLQVENPIEHSPTLLVIPVLEEHDNVTQESTVGSGSGSGSDLCPTMGQSCAACQKQTIALFRVHGIGLVCRSCKRKRRSLGAGTGTGAYTRPITNS